MIDSFKIDHNNLMPGLYVSRVDTIGDYFVTTIDLRLFVPNKTMCIPRAAHTIEHIMADYLRNKSDLKDSVLYFGPMGCMTGFYLMLKGKWSSEDLVEPLQKAFEDCSNSKVIPGCTSKECGNFLFHDSDMSYSKSVMGCYARLLDDITEAQLHYPKEVE